nr:XRE family transcriptional regulator [Streptomyces poonensis]
MSRTSSTASGSRQLTPHQVAASMEVSAPRVFALEHGETDRAEVVRLRASAEALGYRLRVVAGFGDAE